MAEILIQRKRRRSVWPWLLGLAMLALLPLPFLANRGERQQVASGAPRRDTTARAVASAVDSGATAPDSASTQASGGAVVAASAGASAGSASASPGVTGASASTLPRAGVATSEPAQREVATTSSAVTPRTTADRASAERTTATSAGTIAPLETAPAAAPATSGAGTAPAARETSFSRYTATTRAPTNDRAHREYTAEALDRLAAELRSLGAAESGVSVITAHADSLRMPNARSAARPDYARAAFLGAVHQFDLLRARKRGQVNVARLRSAAWAIDPRRSLVAQRATVERFFAAARDALDSLSRRG